MTLLFRCHGLLVLGLLFLSMPAQAAYAEMLEGKPLAFLGGCRMDFDRNGQEDLAMLLDTGNSVNLVLLQEEYGGYNAEVLAYDTGQMLLTCHFGESVMAYPEEEGDSELVELSINGPYLRLTLPESTSMVFFWQDNAFHRAWTAD